MMNSVGWRIGVLIAFTIMATVNAIIVVVGLVDRGRLNWMALGGFLWCAQWVAFEAWRLLEMCR